MSSKSTSSVSLGQMVFVVFALFIAVAIAKFVFSVAMTLLMWTCIAAVALAGMGLVYRLFSGQ